MKEAFVSQAENDDIVKEVFIIFASAVCVNAKIYPTL